MNKEQLLKKLKEGRVNINILINQASNEITEEEINKEIIDILTNHSKKTTLLNILINPYDEVPEQKEPTLIFLGPEYSTSSHELNSKLKDKVDLISTKKGNSDRINRNTILFVVCSDIGLSKLKDDIKNYLACIKIKSEYQNQLETDQKNDINSKIDEYKRKSISSLITAYSILLRHSAKEGINKILVKTFKNEFKGQIEEIYKSLLEEEWIIESVGLVVLRKNNLVPNGDEAINVNDLKENLHLIIL